MLKLPQNSRQTFDNLHGSCTVQLQGALGLYDIQALKAQCVLAARQAGQGMWRPEAKLCRTGGQAYTRPEVGPITSRKGRSLFPYVIGSTRLPPYPKGRAPNRPRDHRLSCKSWAGRRLYHSRRNLGRTAQRTMPRLVYTSR